jgi:hypothetical protein
LLAVAATVLTVGYVEVHRDATISDVVLEAQVRELSGDHLVADATRALVTSPQIAARLSANGTIPAPPADILRAVRVTAPLPDVRIHVATTGAGYAETIARSWLAEVNHLNRALLVAAPADRRRLFADALGARGESYAAALERSARSARRIGFRGGPAAAAVPDLVIAAPVAQVSDRIPRVRSLLAWAAVALAAAGLALCLPGRHPAA